MPQATVTHVSEGQVKAIARRNCHEETLWGQHYDLKRGDKVQAKRQVNNPYLIRVK